MLLPLLFILAQTPLEAAQAACERDYKACPLRDKLQAEQRANTEREIEAKQASLRAQKDQQQATIDAEIADWEKREDARKAKCGKDYGRVRVGMRFKRVQECATLGDEFEMAGQTESGTLYKCNAGRIWVEGGKVTRWLAEDP